MHDPARYENQWKSIVDQAPGVAREVEKLVSAAYREQEMQHAEARQRELAEIDKLIAATAAHSQPSAQYGTATARTWHGRTR